MKISLKSAWLGNRTEKRELKNPCCPQCGKVMDTFADDYWCPKGRIKYTKHGELASNKQSSKAENRKSVVLLQCKNAFLTNEEFHYISSPANQSWEDLMDDKKEENCWLISYMTMAIVQDNGSLGILLKDGTKEEFKLSLDNWTKVSVAGIALFGGVGSLIAGGMAVRNKIKATSQQWAAAINMLISRVNMPEMIFCRYCGTRNKSTEPRCIHCGGILT